MAEPTTTTLIEAMKVCLQAIQVANGYHTNAGTNVLTELRQVPGNAQEVIHVAMAARERASDAAVSRTHRLVTVAVVAKVAASRENAQDMLLKLTDDIEQAFEQRHAAFPKGFTFPVFVDVVPVTPAEGMEWVGAQVRFTSHVPKRQP